MIFYVLIFSVLGVFVVVAAIVKFRGRRRGYTVSDNHSASQPAATQHLSSGEHESGHGHHPTEAARRARKAKRAESRHDRRKRK
jgi:hypothetical protein